MPASLLVAVTEKVADCPDVRFRATGCDVIEGVAATAFVVTDTCALADELR